MTALEELKYNLRKMVKTEISGLSPDYCQSTDEKICQYLLSLADYQQAQTVFCYVGTAGEINTRPILLDVLKRGKRLVVPKCISQGIMEAYQIKDLDDLQSGKYGILEPKPSCLKILPEMVDLGIIPCLTCGSDGKRIGYGGGYYDRYLPRANFTKIALCRARLIKEDIPTDVHDCKMDIVISENGVIR